MSEEEQLKIKIDPALRKELDRVFEIQGVNLKIGLTRLIRYLVIQPQARWAAILSQTPDEGDGDAGPATLAGPKPTPTGPTYRPRGFAPRKNEKPGDEPGRKKGAG